MKPSKTNLLARFVPNFIKRNIPKTLGGRAILIIVVPIVIMQVAITFVFFQMHWETVTARLTEGLVGDIAWAVEAYEEAPTTANLARINAQARDNMQLSIVLQPNQDLPKTKRRSVYVALDLTIKRALNAQMKEKFWFDTTRYPGVVDIRIKVDQGVLRFIAPKDRAFATTGYIFIFWVLGATVLLTSIAILFIRNQVRAIERLSQAAEAFGKGEDYPNFKPYGATEVRAAAQAFLDMRERIVRHIEQRTTLLASVSHDLRTPLTRLKLELAMCDDDDKTPSQAVHRMQDDVCEMAYMIDEYLAFARGEIAENTQDTSINALLSGVVENIKRTGHEVEVSYLSDDINFTLRQVAVQRALSNLVMNGFHYAQNVRMSAQINNDKQGAHLDIMIDDNGPGITPDLRDEAFKAFNRLDAARNQNVKGVGLGLAISRDIIRGHGGELFLEDSPLGGLRARIRLNLA